jgi:uncharacterized protein YjiK
MKSPSILLSCIALALLGCRADTQASPDAPPARSASTTEAPGLSNPYRFDEPTHRFTLPDALREISGLTVLNDRRLGAVQDEDGDLYVLSAESGEVEQIVPFGPPGDYEGIELVGERLFVLRADGAVFEVPDWEDTAADLRDARTRAPLFETGLGADDCNAEGLGADGERLLIACKEEDEDGYHRAYAFSPGASTFSRTPTLLLDPERVPGGKKTLRPSALAVQPGTGHTVVLASKRDALVVLNASGDVLGSWDLSPAELEQPEALAFLPNGDLLVASEGDDGPPLLLRFAPSTLP